MAIPLPVTIQFFGICTHIQPSVIPPSQPADWYHRVVLVNASDPPAANPRHLSDVAPHHASLQLTRESFSGSPPETPWFRKTFDDGRKFEWKLDGVVMHVESALPAEQPRGTAPCIPSLSDHMQIRPDAGRRSYEEDPALASCFFNFAPVFIEPRIFVNAAIAVTTLFAEEPTLVIRRFRSLEEVCIPLSGVGEVSLSNIPDDTSQDAPQDFLLHYLALDTFPDEAWRPPNEWIFDCAPHVRTTNIPRKLRDLTTPGCSNSNYP